MPEPILDPAVDYPLSVHRRELLRTPTGKAIDDITIEAVMAGDVTAADLRITPATLRLQAQLAERSGRGQLGANLRRAAELTAIGDERVLQIYNALRPHAATAAELDRIADELEHDHHATHLAALVRDAAAVYQRRGILASDQRA